MSRIIDEGQARQTALNYVAREVQAAQAEIRSVDKEEIWLMELAWPAQNRNMRGTQFAKISISGSGEVRDFEKTDFRYNSLMRRMASRLGRAFSRGESREEDSVAA